jgi:hypothetical protein
MTDACLRSGARSLVLNEANGFRSESLSFLADMPDLERLQVLATCIHDCAAIEKLPRLSRLSLTERSRTSFDFASMSNLVSASFGSWSQGRYGSILEHPKLRDLEIHAWPRATLHEFAALQQLESLELTASRVERLEGIERLPRLSRLVLLLAPQLVDLFAVAGHPGLRDLWVSKARKLTDISALAKVMKLRWLQLADCTALSSLKALQDHPSLVAIWLKGSIIKDRDLEPLATLPNLKYARITDRAGYSRRGADLPQDPRIARSALEYFCLPSEEAAGSMREI